MSAVPERAVAVLAIVNGLRALDVPEPVLWPIIQAVGVQRGAPCDRFTVTPCRERAEIGEAGWCWKCRERTASVGAQADAPKEPVPGRGA